MTEASLQGLCKDDPGQLPETTPLKPVRTYSEDSVRKRCFCDTSRWGRRPLKSGVISQGESGMLLRQEVDLPAALTPLVYRTACLGFHIRLVPHCLSSSGNKLRSIRSVRFFQLD